MKIKPYVSMVSSERLIKPYISMVVNESPHMALATRRVVGR
jgi:hypothetical protein